MPDILADRRLISARRIEGLRDKLKPAATVWKGKACVYVTGSYGRGEGGAFSDMDLFITGRSQPDANGRENRSLSNLDEICLKRDLIVATRDLRYPDFSGDGEYLAHYTIDSLVRTTGRPDDDANNTFTARLLLLLESRPLVGEDVYWEAIDAVIDKYWRDFDGHETAFVPAFLANDILRLWRTFCVNYEARTSDVPADKKNKRRLKNYKLKYSRMLTCYSALVYLLAQYNRFKTVTKDDARTMVKLSPTERLEWLLRCDHLSVAHDTVRTLLDKYAEFLNNTNVREEELLGRIAAKDTRTQYFDQANAFGDAVFDLIEKIGQRSRLHHMLVV